MRPSCIKIASVLQYNNFHKLINKCSFLPVPKLKRRRTSKTIKIQSNAPLVKDQENTNVTNEVNSVDSECPHCPHCFLPTCVTEVNKEAVWLGDGREACLENAGTRRNIYFRYWNCLSNLDAWDHPLYIAKKTAGAEGSVYHKREIMPNCVLKKVRGLYPNPTDCPYMGHKWE